MSSAKALADRVARTVGSRAIGTRAWSDAAVERIAATSKGLKVLEIGSGRQDLGENAYSLARLFTEADFVQSDVNPAFGHRVVDVTDMSIEEEFDVILCMYVLEHVFDVRAAVDNMRAAVRPGGKVLMAVPHLYPYHDEPLDFWRFTEYSMRELCRDFSTVEVRTRGMRRFPQALLAIATR